MKKYVLTLNGEPKLEELEEHAKTHPSNLLTGVIAALMELSKISWSYKPRLEFERRMTFVDISLVVDGGSNWVNMGIYDKLVSYPFIDKVNIKFEKGKARYRCSINRDWYQSLSETAKMEENT